MESATKPTAQTYPSPGTLANWEKEGTATATHCDPQALELAIKANRGSGAPPPDFVPLHIEGRTHVSTAVMCHHLGRQQQTARGWASAETHPEGLRPIRVMGRLAWPVAGIRKLLGVSA